MSRAKEAVDFCSQFRIEFDKAQSEDEKIILLQVLAERLNTWTLQMKLEQIQKKSKVPQ